MNYEEARTLIKDGDMIAVKRRSGLLAVGTRLVTGSPYTHNGVALWSGGRLLLANANAGGANFIPLSQERHFDFDVFDCPEGVDPDAVVLQAWLLLGTFRKYGFFDLWHLFLHIRFGVALPGEDEDMICSALAARIYQLAGWEPVGLPSIPWPGAVVAAFGKPPRLSVKA